MLLDMTFVTALRGSVSLSYSVHCCTIIHVTRSLSIAKMLNDIAGIILITFSLVIGVEIIYTVVTLTKHGALWDTDLLHIMIFIYYSILMATVFPVISAVLLLAPAIVFTHPTVVLVLLTILKLLFVQYFEVVCFVCVWNTLIVYYPLKCMVWKATNIRQYCYIAMFMLTTAIVVGRSMFVFFHGKIMQSIDYIFFPDYTDGVVLIFVFIYVVYGCIVMSYVLLHRAAKKHLLNRVMIDKSYTENKCRSQLNRLTKKFYIFLLAVICAWTISFVFLHIVIFCDTCISDDVIMFTIAGCMLFDMASVPVIVCGNVRVHDILSQSFKSDVKKMRIFCKPLAPHEDQNKI